jgi:hypothetical protein
MKKALQSIRQGPPDRNISGRQRRRYSDATNDDIVANFNACCDIIENDQKNANDHGPTGVQDWLEVQQQLWTDAKAKQKRWINFATGWQAPLQTARVFDKFADVIAEITREGETETRIVLAAQNLLDGRNGETSSLGASVQNE